MGEKRKSGLRDPFEGIEELDFSYFTAPYLNLSDEYQHQLYAIKRNKLGWAYLVTYVDEPDLFYVTFTTNKDKAKGIITKYYKENLHPNFIGRRWREKYNKCRAIRVPEFDVYARTKKIPVEKLMEVLGVSVSCSGCGRHSFNYEDLKEKRCYLLEGEGGVNEFSTGYIICPDCYRQLMK